MLGFFTAPGDLTKSAIILSKKTTPAIHMNAIKLMKTEFLPTDYSRLGCMKSERWAELAEQLKEVDVVPSDFNPSTSYNLSFLSNCE